MHEVRDEVCRGRCRGNGPSSSCRARHARSGVLGATCSIREGVCGGVCDGVCEGLRFVRMNGRVSRGGGDWAVI